jgi:hypothetical protein
MPNASRFGKQRRPLFNPDDPSSMGPDRNRPSVSHSQGLRIHNRLFRGVNEMISGLTNGHEDTPRRVTIFPALFFRCASHQAFNGRNSILVREQSLSGNGYPQTVATYLLTVICPEINVAAQDGAYRLGVHIAPVAVLLVSWGRRDSKSLPMNPRGDSRLTSAVFSTGLGVTWIA